MDRNKAKQVREYLNKVLSENPNELGVKIEVGSISFGLSNANIKMNVSDIAENGEAITRDAEDFTLSARQYGLDPEWLNQTFEYNGIEHKIVGLRSRARKKPVLVEASGKTYIFGADLVRLNMDRKVALDKVE